MVSRIDYSPQAPGPDMSSRYPIAPGPNYQKWKEQKGFIYDPYHDRYVADPKAQQELAYSQGLAERPKEPPGLFESLAPVAGVGTALYGGKWLGEHGFDKISGLFGGGEVAKQGAAQAAGSGSGIAGGFVESAGANGFSPVGMDAANYFESPGIGVAPYLGAAGAGLGAYGLFNAVKDNDVKSGALSGAGMGAGLAAAAPLVGLGPVGWGGLALGAGLGALGGAGITGLFGHESTRDLAKKHTSGLLDKGENDPAWQGYVSGMREQFNSAPPDPSKPFHGGQYGSWDEYKKAGLDAADLTGVYGNLNVYGPKWASLTEDQRRAITQKNIDSGLYTSKKGEVEITDSGTAQSNFDSVVNAKPTGMMEPRRSTPRPTQPSKSTQRRK